MRNAVIPALFLAAATLSACSGHTCSSADSSIEHGRYLATIGGCNDCHTTGFAPSGGKVPEAQWLQGDNVGWRGPWGTTYPINLRLLMQTLSEEQWITLARHSKARPPMPTYVLGLMSDADLKAIYRYVRSLGPAGSPAPAYVPPDQEPKTAFINFVPQPPKP